MQKHSETFFIIPSSSDKLIRCARQSICHRPKAPNQHTTHTGFKNIVSRKVSPSSLFGGQHGPPLVTVETPGDAILPSDGDGRHRHGRSSQHAGWAPRALDGSWPEAGDKDLHISVGRARAAPWRTRSATRATVSMIRGSAPASGNSARSRTVGCPTPTAWSTGPEPPAYPM